MYSIDGHAELRVGEWRVTSDLESQSVRIRAHHQYLGLAC